MNSPALQARFAAAALFSLCLVAPLASQAETFSIVEAKGAASATTAGARGATPVEAEASYPLGSQLRTGEDGSLVIALPAESRIEIKPNTRLTLTLDPEDRSVYRATLDQGAAEITLTGGFHESWKLEVETVNGTCVPTGTRFGIAVDTETDYSVVVIDVKEGTVVFSGRRELRLPSLATLQYRLRGPDDALLESWTTTATRTGRTPLVTFDIEEIGAGDTVSIAFSNDGTWVRVEGHEGEVTIKVLGADGEWRTLEIETGFKIFLDYIPGDLPLADTTILMPPTTTTTVPSPTPVGDR